MVWDWQRGLRNILRNTPFHRLAECQLVDVVQALVLNLSAKEMGTTDEFGCASGEDLPRRHTFGNVSTGW